MADSYSESHAQSNKVCLRHLSSSFFNVPGFFLGFSSRGSSDSESLRSPTSPLDFSFFSNITNPFSHKSPRSPSHGCKQKKWSSHKLGLGIINLLADESGVTDDALGSPGRKSIIFGPQVKGDYSMRSNSLPRNYIFSLISQNKEPFPALGKSDAIFGKGEVPLEPESPEIVSSIGLKPKPILSSKTSFSENASDTITSLPLDIGKGVQIGDSLDIKPSSLPMPIGSCRGCVGSLSARDIELSEDYTCIISHGPNPKTTHIFGDYILECPTNELPNFDSKGGPGVEFPQEAYCPEGSNPTPYLSDDFLNFCSSCKKKLEKGDDFYMYRGEKAFCSFDCRSEGIFSQEEVEKTCDNSSKSSPSSSYHEDFFLVALDDQKL